MKASSRDKFKRVASVILRLQIRSMEFFLTDRGKNKLQEVKGLLAERTIVQKLDFDLFVKQSLLFLFYLAVLFFPFTLILIVTFLELITGSEVWIWRYLYFVLLLPFWAFLIKWRLKEAGDGVEVNHIELKKPPGSYLAKIVEILPPKYRENLLQNISDMRLEYFEAIEENNIWQAKLIVAFYYFGLCWSGIVWISDKLKEITKTTPKID